MLSLLVFCVLGAAVVMGVMGWFNGGCAGRCVVDVFAYVGMSFASLELPLALV